MKRRRISFQGLENIPPGFPIIGKIALAGGWALLGAALATAAPGPFMSFDMLPATPSNALPGSGGDWLYTTKEINSNGAYYMTQYDCDGWRSTNGYATPAGTVFTFFYRYLCPDGGDHMGWPTYGYLEIDPTNAVKGHSLRFSVTGGAHTAETNGLIVTTKAHYTNYLNLGQDPAGTNSVIGHPYLYFSNTSGTNAPFPQAPGANRLSVYFCAPATMTNRDSIARPLSVVNVGPYNGVGGHWYHEFCTQGGGWTHLLCDGHPQHNNSWSSPSNFPYPSKSMRDMGPGYFTNLYRWYITFKPYSGIGWPVYRAWFDEIEFQCDPEPQNNETIASPSVAWFPASNMFEIGFMDKYKDCAKSYSTYEVRYSFQPIGNADWGSATPVHVLTNACFKIQDRADGRFQKYSPYYQAVWAPFRLANTDDTRRLTPGTPIFFAVKDISQIGGDSQLPVTNSGIGQFAVDGRNYMSFGTNFDYAGDQPALPLIKRIDFRIPKDTMDTDLDGLPDWWELFHFQNPTSAPPDGDPDSDLDLNLREYLADTDPNDSNSFLRISQVSAAASSTVSFACSAARFYTLARGTDPVPDQWLIAGGPTDVAGDPSGAMTMADTNPGVVWAYRIEATKP